MSPHLILLKKQSSVKVLNTLLTTKSPHDIFIITFIHSIHN